MRAGFVVVGEMVESGLLVEYFENEEEARAAGRVVTVFHGRILIDHSLGRRRMVLLGIYMLCNKRRSPCVGQEEAREFLTKELGIDGKEVSKGIYDAVREKGWLTENGDVICFTKKGIDAVKQIIYGEEKEE